MYTYLYVLTYVYVKNVYVRLNTFAYIHMADIIRTPGCIRKSVHHERACLYTYVYIPV